MIKIVIENPESVEDITIQEAANNLLITVVEDYDTGREYHDTTICELQLDSMIVNALAKYIVTKVVNEGSIHDYIIGE